MITPGCPNCGGRLEGDAGAVRCTHCGSQLAFPPPAAAPRESRARRPREVIVPAIGCVAIYAVVFMVLSLVLSTAGLQERMRPLTAAVSIIAAVLGFVMMIRRR